jgi:hydroxymethylpyrimidine kinase/phosphomethylpyrimidine kinase
MIHLLLVSGLDPSGGAGFLADARAAEQHGIRAVGVVTALTVQTSEGVRAVEPASADVVGEQLTALLGDIEVAAGKIGMLGSEAVAEAVASALRLTAAPIVWDPVLVSSSGKPLYFGQPSRALELLRDHLEVVTPNLAEAAALTGFPVDDVLDMRRAAEAIADQGVSCLVKGGHLRGPPVDVLATGGRVIEIRGERVPGGEEVHGTGCLLATALACRLARHAPLAAAVSTAIGWVRSRILEPVRAGRGKPSVM